jgi:hypothetical protein
MTDMQSSLSMYHRPRGLFGTSGKTGRPNNSQVPRRGDIVQAMHKMFHANKGSPVDIGIASRVGALMKGSVRWRGKRYMLALRHSTLLSSISLLPPNDTRTHIENRRLFIHFGLSIHCTIHTCIASTHKLHYDQERPSCSQSRPSRLLIGEQYSVAAAQYPNSVFRKLQADRSQYRIILQSSSSYALCSMGSY